MQLARPLWQLIPYLYIIPLKVYPTPFQQHFFTSMRAIGNLLKIRPLRDSKQQPASIIYEESDYQQSYQIHQQGLQENDDKTMENLINEFRYQLMLEEQTATRRVSKKPLPPTDDEVTEVANALLEHYPTNAQDIIKHLFNTLIPLNILRCRRKIPYHNPTNQQEIQQAKQALYRKNPISKVQHNIEAVDKLKKYASFKKLYPKESYIPPSNFSSPHQEQRMMLRTMAARSFVYRGKAIFFMRQQLLQNKINIQIDETRYHPILDSIIIEAYRFLQHFIYNQCQIPIQFLVRNEKKYISSRLLYCRESLKKSECEVLLNIVKILYGLETVQLDEYATIKLFHITQKGLRYIMLKQISTGQRKTKKEAQTQPPCKSCGEVKKAQEVDTKSFIYEKSIENKEKIELHNIWTIRMEQQFIQKYKRVQHFTDIKRFFRTKYPQYKQFFKGNGLRNRFNQIQRAAMRKVREIVAKCSQPTVDLVKMNDNMIKYIMKSSRALKARLLLVDVYLDDNKTYNSKIEAVVNELNQAIADKPYYKSGTPLSEPISQSGEQTGDTLYFPPVYAPMRAKDYIRTSGPKQRKSRGRKSQLFNQLYGEEERKIRMLDMQSQRSKQQGILMEESVLGEEDDSFDQCSVLTRQNAVYDAQLSKFD